MTSIVIPLGRGSKYHDLELRMALRSVEKHLTGYGDIFIIGEKPAWIQNVIHIPATDGTQTYDKERNIFNKIMIACNDERVSEDFLFMNDDHYLLRDYEAVQFPYYYEGLLQDYKTVSQYKHTIWNTLKVHEACFDDKYFDIHCPIVYKKKYLALLNQLDWNIPYGYAIKSLYCAAWQSMIQGLEYPDLKIKDPLPYAVIIRMLQGRSWFSIGDGAFAGEVRTVLEDLYSVPSKYEKT